jgi:hypothetical protein
LQGRTTALGLLHHSRSDALLTGYEIGDVIQVQVVSGNDLTLRYGLLGPAGSVEAISGADTDHEKFSRAMATVTLLMMIFGSINRVLLPASRAAGSATAGKATLS